MRSTHFLSESLHFIPCYAGSTDWNQDHHRSPYWCCERAQNTLRQKNIDIYIDIKVVLQFGLTNKTLNNTEIVSE